METNRDRAAEVSAAVSEAFSRSEMTQTTLAEATGIPLTTLHRKLSGKSSRGFDVVEILAICEVLGISFTALASRVEHAGRVAA